MARRYGTPKANSRKVGTTNARPITRGKFWLQMLDGPCKGDYEKAHCEVWIIMLVTEGPEAGRYCNYRRRDVHKVDTTGGPQAAVRKTQPDGVYYFDRFIRPDDTIIQDTIRYDNECERKWAEREAITVKLIREAATRNGGTA